MKLSLLSVAVPLSLMSAGISAAPVDSNTPNTPQNSYPSAAPSGDSHDGGPPNTKKPAKQPVCPGMGILLKNARKEKATYYFYNNYWNGDGEAGANFDKPDHTIPLDANEVKHVPLNADFKGRIRK